MRHFSGAIIYPRDCPDGGCDLVGLCQLHQSVVCRAQRAIGVAVAQQLNEPPVFESLQAGRKTSILVYR